MWRINPWYSGYGWIGQTWSMPRVSRVKGPLDTVLIMGGGYDPSAEDVIPAGTPTIGRGVYISVTPGCIPGVDEPAWPGAARRRR